MKPNLSVSLKIINETAQIASKEYLSFFRKKTDFEKLARWTRMKQVAALLQHSESLPKHPLCENELLFDRFLLHYSPAYRKTRELAHQLGIELIPTLQSVPHAFESFDTLKNAFFYTPLTSEIRWITEQHVERSDFFIERYKDLRYLIHPLYHDLNHAIFFRLCRQSHFGGTKQELVSYYSWIESLVHICDVAVTEELGPISLLLEKTGPIYKGFCEGLSKDISYKRKEIFIPLHVFSTLENAGLSLREIKTFHSNLSLKISTHPLKRTSPEFINVTSANWIRHQVKKYKRALPHPEVAPAWKSKIYRFALHSDPRKMLSSPVFTENTYQWYFSIFN